MIDINAEADADAENGSNGVDDAGFYVVDNSVDGDNGANANTDANGDDDADSTRTNSTMPKSMKTRCR